MFCEKGNCKDVLHERYKNIHHDQETEVFNKGISKTVVIFIQPNVLTEMARHTHLF